MRTIDAEPRPGRRFAIVVATIALGVTGTVPSAAARPAPDRPFTVQVAHGPTAADAPRELRLCFMGRWDWNTALVGPQRFC